MSNKSATQRTSLSKRLRFEIFKRDYFSCQYCGSKPPKVILEIDHIVPVSKGGDNSKGNLVTACFDCNRGKSNKSLNSIPSPLIENMEQLKEKEEQLKAYKRLMNQIKKRETKEIETIDDIYNDYFEGYILSDRFKNSSLKNFISKLGYSEVEDAMHKACGRIYDSNKAIKYFCGICWTKIKEQS